MMQMVGVFAVCYDGRNRGRRPKLTLQPEPQSPYRGGCHEVASALRNTDVVLLLVMLSQL